MLKVRMIIKMYLWSILAGLFLIDRDPLNINNIFLIDKALNNIEFPMNVQNITRVNKLNLIEGGLSIEVRRSRTH